MKRWADLSLGGACFGYSRLLREDRASYGPAWTPLAVGTVGPREYRYNRDGRLFLPVFGEVGKVEQGKDRVQRFQADWYGHGGYSVEMGGSLAMVQNGLLSLERQGWIDRRTRLIQVCR